MENQCVPCEVWTEYLYIIYIYLEILKGLKLGGGDNKTRHMQQAGYETRYIL
jgi:hypothetical protein